MGNEVKKKQLSNVDIMKFILSLMVVCIHTGVTSLMPAEIEKFFNAIFNLAVPIFFVYSGYLFAYKNKMDKKDKLIKYSKHIVKLYIYGLNLSADLYTNILLKMVGQYKNVYII